MQNMLLRLNALRVLSCGFSGRQCPVNQVCWTCQLANEDETFHIITLIAISDYHKKTDRCTIQ